AGRGRVEARQFGPARRWIHAEHRAAYDEMPEDPTPILRRFLAHAGPTSAGVLATRYGLSVEVVTAAFGALGRDVVSGRFAPGGDERWVDRFALEQIHRRTLSLLRQEVRPVPIYAYAEFLRRWQRVGDASHPSRLGEPADEDA